MGLARKTRDVVEVESTTPPYQKPHRTWAGLGSGTLCDLCHRPIEEHQIEYEVELPAGALIPVLNMHLGCYEQWTTSEPQQV
jgi:hypothetical protein